MIEGHGDDAYRYGNIKYNFSSNIYSKANHEKLMAYLASLGNDIACYPEPEPYTLERRLAGECGGVPEKSVMVTNGATEAIYMIAHCFRGARSSILAPTFKEYQDACFMHNHNVAFHYTVDNLADNCDVVWLCNPNNPTGRVLDKEMLLALVGEHPDVQFIIDQAYSDYTSKELLTESEAVECGNVVLLSSLTKRFTVPGLRIGYAIGAEKLMNCLRNFRMPWSVNVFAINAANYLLDHKNEYIIDSVLLHSEIGRFARKISALGIESIPTDTNFALFTLPEGRSSAELKEYLASQHGILIRDASNFEGLSNRHFRVAAQSRMENDILIEAIESWITH